MKSLILSLILASLVIMPAAKATSMYVSGDVWGTWSADSIIVMDSVRVPPDCTLIIQPGVEVFFWSYVKFKVDNNATLTAVGTVNDSIRFDESWFWPGIGWHGIRFLSASSASRLEYCHLKNGYAWGSGDDANGGAIYCYNSSPTVQNCLMDSCSAQEYGGAIYCNSSNAFISGNTISGNSAGYYGGGIFCNNSSPTISGNGISENSGSGIYCEGSSPSISGNTISGNSGSYGGGIHCYYSSPNISGNTISGNSAPSSYGGGIYCDNSSSPTISGNTISANSSLKGGGIYCVGSNLSIIDNTISGNSIFYSYGGGGIYCTGFNLSISGNTISGNSGGNGGGIYCEGSSHSISDNTISGNSVYSNGGGIYCTASSTSISNNTISGNSATNGGGVYFYSSSPVTFELNEISLNTALGNGGGIFFSYSSPNMNKNTIAGNSATLGGGIYSTSSTPVLNNCILWGNASQLIYQGPGSNVQATYSDINFFPVWPGTGNINADPLFENASAGNYLLQASSPCINTGDPNPIYNDPNGTRADMGCYYYGWVGVNNPEIRDLPTEFALLACFPNPFNPVTSISYKLQASSYVTLQVYDTAGRLVATLVNGWRQAGEQEVIFDGSHLASGIYIYRLKADRFESSQKMVLLK